MLETSKLMLQAYLFHLSLQRDAELCRVGTTYSVVLMLILNPLRQSERILKDVCFALFFFLLCDLNRMFSGHTYLFVEEWSSTSLLNPLRVISCCPPS